MMAFNINDTLDVLSRTLWAEARNQTRLGIEAVASVILTRAAHPRWWGHDIKSVCLAPYQFSCWLPSDPQAAEIRGNGIVNSTALVECIGIAKIALAGNLADPTHGADYYANLAVCDPKWARGVTPVAKIGAHTFFRLEVPPPGAHPLPTPAATAGAVGTSKASAAPPLPAKPGNPPQRPILDPADALNAAEEARIRAQQAGQS